MAWDDHSADRGSLAMVIVALVWPPSSLVQCTVGVNPRRRQRTFDSATVSLSSSNASARVLNSGFAWEPFEETEYIVPFIGAHGRQRASYSWAPLKEQTRTVPGAQGQSIRKTLPLGRITSWTSGMMPISRAS